MRSFLVLAIYVMLLASFDSGCKHHPVEPDPPPVPEPFSNPPLSGTFALCYVKGVAGSAHVLISVPSIRDVSQLTAPPPTSDDECPAWSPNGRYIAFQRSAPVFGPWVHVYDLVAKTDTNLTADGGLVASRPFWTIDGQLCICYQRPLGSSTATYLVRPDGSGRRKILDAAPATVYFYDDSYRFVYCSPGDSTWYRTNLDHTIQEAVFNTTVSAGQYFTVRDFNGKTGDFLINTNTISGIAGSALATYNADTKKLTLLLAPDGGYGFSMQRYSSDRTKIVFIEYNGSSSYLSVLASGVKTRLVFLTNSSHVYFGSDPMQFSPNGQFVAFSKTTMGSSGGWVTLSSDLYVVDAVTRGLQHIDSGAEPSWNPAVP